MNRYDIQLDILIGLVYMLILITGEESDFFLVVTMVLIYAILKSFQHVLMLLKVPYAYMTYIILGYLLVAQFFYPGMAMFIVINIMSLQPFNKHIKISLTILFLAISYGLFPEWTMEIFLVGGFSMIGMLSFEASLGNFQKDKGQILDLKQEVDQLKLQAVLNKRMEDEISTISRLEERNVIAQQLHDKLGHTISGNIIQLEAVATLMDYDQEKAKERLLGVKNNLGNGMDEIRALLKSMKPETSALNINKIKTMVQETEAQSNIRISLTYDDVIKVIPYQAWKVIMTNTRESLTNMMKYAGATRCSIDISRLNKKIRIHISDNGKGCGPIKKGMGLKGMEERLLAIGGRLMVDGSDGFNTVMLIDLEEKDERN